MSKKKKKDHTKRPLSAKIGRVILAIACVFVGLAGLIGTAGWIVRFVATFVRMQITPEVTFPGLEWWPLLSAADNVINIFSYTFMSLACVAGFAWLKQKGRIQWLCSWFALFSLALILVDFFFAVNQLVSSGNWITFLNDILKVDFGLVLYFIGWFLAKDDYK